MEAEVRPIGDTRSLRAASRKRSRERTCSKEMISRMKVVLTGPVMRKNRYLRIKHRTSSSLRSLLGFRKKEWSISKILPLNSNRLPYFCRAERRTVEEKNHLVCYLKFKMPFFENYERDLIFMIVERLHPRTFDTD